jgi:Cu/Ag efflux pump CusA
LKSVLDIVDVSSFGYSPTRAYRVRVDPHNLIACGLSLAQAEEQIAGNNVNASGRWIRGSSCLPIAAGIVKLRNFENLWLQNVKFQHSGMR